MLNQFGYVGLFLIIAIGFILVTLIIPIILSRFTKIVPRNPSQVKQETYECGMETTGRSWVQFNFRYYFYALLLIALDVLVIFLYPWAVEARSLGVFGFAVVGVFIVISTIGYLYAWKKGVLEWK